GAGVRGQQAKRAQRNGRAGANLHFHLVRIILRITGRMSLGRPAAHSRPLAVARLGGIGWKSMRAALRAIVLALWSAGCTTTATTASVPVTVRGGGASPRVL